MDYTGTQAQAKTLRSPNDGLQGRISQAVVCEADTVGILRQVLIRLRGQVPEEIGTKASPTTPREISLLEHMQSLEALQTESRRLAGELANIV